MKNIAAGPEKVVRILRTVMEIFGRQDFIRGKIDRIANQAQVSKGLPFHYFGNKQALYLDVFKYVYRRIYDHMDPKRQQSVSGLAATITTTVKYELKLQFKFPAEYHLMMQAYTDLLHSPEPLQQQV